MKNTNYDWKKDYEDWCEMTYALLPIEEAEERINEVSSVERYKQCIERLNELQRRAIKAIETYEGSNWATPYEMIVREGHLTAEEYDEMLHLEWLIC